MTFQRSLLELPSLCQLILDTFVSTWVVFGHVCLYGLNKVNFHLDFGVIQGKIILLVNYVTFHIHIVESTHFVLNFISKHFVCPFEYLKCIIEYTLFNLILSQ